MVDASPRRTPHSTIASMKAWLDSWPQPFGSHAEAVAFFGGATKGQAWAAGLDQRADGLHPRFEPGIVLEALAGLAVRDWWDEWQAVRCPTMLVLGEHSIVDPEDVTRMAACGPKPSVVTVAGTGHDVHLDDPAAFARALARFLAALGAH